MKKTRGGTSRTSLLMIIIVGFFVAGCASTSKYDPFKVPKADIRSKVKTIALAALGTPDDLEIAALVQAEFETLIRARLEQGGFSVISSQEFTSIWDKVKGEAGGFFDPITGKVDTAKYNSARTAFFQQLRENTRADAILFPKISVRKVKYGNSNFEVKWDGTSESVQSGEATVFAIMTGTYSHGTVIAFSLRVKLEDNSGLPLFENYGGIQLGAKLTGIPMAGLVGAAAGSRSFELVPSKVLFTDSERNRKAVNIALDPLIE